MNRWSTLAALSAIAGVTCAPTATSAQAEALAPPPPSVVVVRPAPAPPRAHRVPGREMVIEEDASARVARLAVMTLAGALASVGGAFGMFELGCALGGGRSPSGEIGDGCGIYGMILGGAGLVVLTPVSVLVSGLLMDGNGGVMWTLLGSLIGFAAGNLASIPIALDGLAEEQLIPLLIGPVLGAVLAYELTSDASRAQVQSQRGAGIEWRTSIAPTDGGGMVGVSGSF